MPCRQTTREWGWGWGWGLPSIPKERPRQIERLDLEEQASLLRKRKTKRKKQGDPFEKMPWILGMTRNQIRLVDVLSFLASFCLPYNRRYSRSNVYWDPA